MAKHEEHEEHENHERWLVSYADFITLLFAFFVVLYAISAVDQKRAIQVEKAVKWALHIAGNGGSGDKIFVPDGSLPSTRTIDIVGMQANTRERTNQLETTRARIAKKVSNLQTGEARPSVLVVVEGQRLILRVAATRLFDEGSSTLRPAALPTLDAVLAEVGALGHRVRVEGHTDASRHQSVFDKNWELSATRAAAVVAYAQATKAVPPERMSLAGFGARRPIASNDNADGREQNRRIDIVVEMEE